MDKSVMVAILLGAVIAAYTIGKTWITKKNNLFNYIRFIFNKFSRYVS
ncbi:hypothetical protein KTC96_18295 [Clostridium estertheticum]|nr:hypothetical protein [Clostridium estertheticum]MBX4258674.1 hypothetical protein [Clostridium estertheticum]WLC69856.1 hypothetical protein KTC96_18295 [Clostridium estertheticum]